MISVIVPAYNAAGTIKHCLNSLLDQDFADYEIIVIDDGSNDSTGDICKNYMQEQQNIRYIRQENAGPSAARNNGTQNAKGEYITFVDSDIFVWDGWYEALHKTFANSDKIGAVGAKLINPLNNRIIDFGIMYSKYNSAHTMMGLLYNHPLSMTDRCVQAVCSAIMMTSKSIFEKVGYG